MSVLNERVQHQHILTLMDSLADGLLGRGHKVHIIKRKIVMVARYL